MTNSKKIKKVEKVDLKKRSLLKKTALAGVAGISLAALSKIPLASSYGIMDKAQLKNYSEVVNAIGSTGGGTQDIDLTLGNVVTATVDTSANTFTFSNPPASGKAGSFTLILTNGGSQTVNWPTSVKWPSGTAPTLSSSGTDTLVFTTTDGGTTWYGFSPSQVSGTPTPQSFYQDIVDAGLTTGLKMCFDAGSSNSYSGSGQSWLDLSGNGYDMFRGDDGTSEATDPSFNGTAGGLTSSEYWSFDGGDYFTYDTTVETWMNNLHKDNAKLSYIVIFYTGTTTDQQIIMTGAAPIATGAVTLQYTGGSKVRFSAEKTGANVMVATSDASITANTWHFLGGSIDEATGAGGSFLYRNGAYDQVSSADTFDATYTSPDTGACGGFKFGAYTNNSDPFTSGSRLAIVAIWESVVLTKAQMDTLYTAVKDRFGIV